MEGRRPGNVTAQAARGTSEAWGLRPHKNHPTPFELIDEPRSQHIIAAEYLRPSFGMTAYSFVCICDEVLTISCISFGS